MTKTLETALEKLNRADRRNECTAVLTADEARAILQKIEMLNDTIEEYHYEKSTRD